MMLLEYDKREFRLIEVGVGEVYRTGYKDMCVVNGFYKFIADNGDYYYIPRNQVVVKELSNNNWLPRV